MAQDDGLVKNFQATMYGDVMIYPLDTLRVGAALCLYAKLPVSKNADSFPLSNSDGTPPAPSCS